MGFDDKMTVMQVRPLYSTVYPFKPSLRLEEQYLQSKREFLRFIKGVTSNWKDGDYFLRNTQGTFAYFCLEGNKVKLMRKSKTGREYLCWNYFKPDIEDKLPARKTAAKKTIKKK